MHMQLFCMNLSYMLPWHQQERITRLGSLCQAECLTSRQMLVILLLHMQERRAKPRANAVCRSVMLSITKWNKLPNIIIEAWCSKAAFKRQSSKNTPPTTLIFVKFKWWLEKLIIKYFLIEEFYEKYCPTFSTVCTVV